MDGEFGEQGSHRRLRAATVKYSPSEQNVIRFIIWRLVTVVDPFLHIQVSYQRMFSFIIRGLWRCLHQSLNIPSAESSFKGYSLSRVTFHFAFANQDSEWSWKPPSYIQKLKYTRQNLAFYAAYVWWIRRQDLRKVKLMDKVHYEGKNVSRRQG